ncbi:class IIb bacteriocin, lactobin A/cerein 7B family [Muricauda sp. NFXS6]
MKSNNEYGVVELKKDELSDINGGVIGWLLAGFIVGLIAGNEIFPKKK